MTGVKRVLLTGAGGLVGSHVLRHLLTHTDWQVVCPVTFRHRGNGDRIATALGRWCDRHPECGPVAGWAERVQVVMCDLAAPVSPTTADRFGQIDYLFNIAADSHVDRSIADPVPFVRNNVELMLSVLELARVARPRLVLQMSTDEVYGPAPAGLDHPEWSPIVPSNPYSASKAAQEAVAVSYWRTYGVPLVLTNTMNIIGETQDPEKFVPRTVRALARREPVTVHVAPDGTPGSRFYLHARNLADAWLFLVRHYEQAGGPPAYPDADRPARFNVVGEREVSNVEMVRLVADAMEVRDPHLQLVDFHTSRPGHDLRYALDGSALAALGWKAPVPFEQSLRQAVAWTLRHPAWMHTGGLA